VNWSASEIAVIAIMSLVLVASLLSYLQAKRSLSWERVSGFVVAHSFQSGRADEDGGQPLIRYEYMVNSMSYQSERIGFDSFSMSEAAAQSLFEQFPIGSRIVVFVNPKKPQQAVFIPGSTGGSLFLITGSILTICICVVSHYT
jgi:hypothetical protein